MSNLIICRICMCQNVKMYDNNSFNLKSYYQEIITKDYVTNVQIPNVLPQYFCYECAAMLYKFHKFKQKCHVGHQTLVELLAAGNITITTIEKKRITHNLKSSLGFVTANSRMKAYTVNGEYLPPATLVKTEYINVDNYDTLYKNKMQIDLELEEVNVKSESELKNFSYKDSSDSDDSLTVNQVFVPVRTLKQDNSKKLKNSKRNKIYETTEELSTNNKKVNNKKKTTVNIKSKIKKSDKVNKKIKRKPSGVNLFDPTHWLIIKMTREEAVNNFKATSLDPKYIKAAHKCEKCYKTFKTIDSLSNHLQLSHSKVLGPFQCGFCGRRYKFKSELRTHLNVHYYKYQCLRCNKVVIYQGSAHLHNKYHDGISPKCKLCGLEFKAYSSYYAHFRLKHPSEHICSLCGESCVSVVGLRQHNRLKHRFDVTDQKKSEEKTYCSKCDITFKTVKAYDAHFKRSKMHENDEPRPKVSNKGVRKPTTCRVCKKEFPSSTSCRMHHKTDHPRSTISLCMGPETMCHICGRTMPPAMLKTHINGHTSEILYPCKICGIKLKYKCNMRRHMETHAEPGKKNAAHKCPLCDKKYTQKANMKEHYRTIHLNHPPRKRIRKVADISLGRYSGDD